MGFFDDPGAAISGAIDSAKDSIGGAITAVEDGLADGLDAVETGIGDAASNIGGAISGAVGDIAGGITGAIGGIGGALGALGTGALSAINAVKKVDVTLPLPNPLFDYASYNYILGLSVIPLSYYSNPDSTYMKGKVGNIICKSGAVDPENRISLPWGKFDFFIEELILRSNISLSLGSNSNLTGDIDLKIVEPYSMGMFFTALEVAAVKAGWKNWKDATFLLTVEFRGNKETGEMVNIPTTARYIPIKLYNLDLHVTEKGSEYKLTATPYNDQSLKDQYTKFKSDHSVSGTTVEQMLQTGEKSLQAVINRRLKQVADINGLGNPDKVLILFPTKEYSSQDKPATATITSDAPTVPTDIEIYNSLGVFQTSSNPDNYIQTTSSRNAIATAKLSFNETRQGQIPVAKDNNVVSKDGKDVIRGKNTINPKITDMKFTQDTDITNAINQVIMMSDFVDKTLDVNNITKEGYKGWWAIHPQTIPYGPETKTGERAKIHVYRVIPYNVQVSSAPNAANTKPVGINELKGQAVKVYNYIYTGKNVDIIKFNIDFKFSFQDLMPADSGSSSTDVKTAANQSGSGKAQDQMKPLGDGKDPETDNVGFIPTVTKFIKTVFNTDRYGGGGVETPTVRMARTFHDSITKGNDMLNLDMEIIGDPYWIVQSGCGTYVAKPTQYQNLNADGTVNPLSGEIHVVVNLFNPSDINQATGFYDFQKSSPVKQFSGIYRVKDVVSKFAGNKFTQTLTMNRLPLQEAKRDSAKADMFGKKTIKNPLDPANNSMPNLTSTGPNNFGALGGVLGEITAITKAGGSLLSSASTLVGDAKSALSAGIGGITGAAGAGGSLTSLTSNVSGAVAGLTSSVGGAVSGLTGAVGGAVSGLTGAVGGAANSLTASLGGALGSLPASASGLVPGTPPDLSKVTSLTASLKADIPSPVPKDLTAVLSAAVPAIPTVDLTGGNLPNPADLAKGALAGASSAAGALASNAASLSGGLTAAAGNLSGAGGAALSKVKGAIGGLG